MSLTGGGWGIALRARLIGFLALAAVTPVLLAAEPEGPIRLRTEWVDRQARDGSPVVRLSVEPLVPLDEITLTLTMPLDFAAIPKNLPDAFDSRPHGPDRRSLRVRILPTSPSVHDFEMLLPPDGFGVLEFIVEGRGVNGKTVRHAIGIPAGESPPTGTVRKGAMEFPAVMQPGNR